MNRRQRIAVAAVILACTPALLANRNVPEPAQAGPVLLRGADVHTLNGGTIERGDVLLVGGKIDWLGPSGSFDASSSGYGDVTIFELAGLHIYPGLISANTVLGLVEIQSVRGSVDVTEAGAINPNTRAEIAINPDSENIAVARANGVLAALTAPLTAGNLIAGRSAVIQLDGWTWEDMTIRAPVGMHMTLPTLRVPDGLEGPQRSQFVEQRDERLKLLRQSITDAQSYKRARDSDPQLPIDRRWEAMMPVLNGDLPVFMHANSLSQVRLALNLAEEFDFELVIVGGADAWRIADVLAEREVAVILAGLHRTPSRRWEGYSLPSEAPRRLQAAGVKVAIANGGGTFVAPHERNLPYEAAEAVAWGLEPDEALRMITLYPAEILGVEERLGSIETGKDATLIVTDGNPLDIRSNVLRAFIQGREIDLSSRHTELNDKYSERLRQVEAE